MSQAWQVGDQTWVHRDGKWTLGRIRKVEPTRLLVRISNAHHETTRWFPLSKVATDAAQAATRDMTRDVTRDMTIRRRQS